MPGMIVGALLGGAVVWFWRDQIASMLKGNTRLLRQKAADSLETLGKQTEELLDQAKPRISSTLRAGQDAIRPAQGMPHPTPSSTPESFHRTG